MLCCVCTMCKVQGSGSCVLCFNMQCSVQDAGWGEAPRGWSGVEEEGWRDVSRVVLMLMLLVLVLGSADRC